MPISTVTLSAFIERASGWLYNSYLFLKYIKELLLV